MVSLVVVVVCVLGVCDIFPEPPKGVEEDLATSAGAREYKVDRIVDRQTARTRPFCVL